MRICENVEMLQLTNDHGTLSPLLIWDDTHMALIDAGLPGQIELFERELTGLGFTLSQITHLILTHQDMDHVGCVMELKEASPGLKILTHEREAPYIDGTKTPVKLAVMEKSLDSLPQEQQEFFTNAMAYYHNRAQPIDHKLQDGEVLPICGGIEVIHTPGHTPGHICLYLRRGQVLVTGDGMNVVEGKLAGPNPQYSLDIDQAIRSLKKLEGYTFQSAVAYHGGLYTGDVRQTIQDIMNG